jgi:hypothetical protein
MGHGSRHALGVLAPPEGSQIGGSGSRGRGSYRTLCAGSGFRGVDWGWLGLACGPWTSWARVWLIGSKPQLEDRAPIAVFHEAAFDQVRRRPPSGTFANMCSYGLVI